MQPKSRRKIILEDLGGYGLIILAILTGWLPGPGGVPLFFAGLNLLARNHEWANRLQSYLIKNGSNLLNKFFPEHKIIMFIWDVVVILAIGIGAYAIFGLTGFLRTIVATAFLAGALVAFARNRRRYQRVSGKLRSR